MTATLKAVALRMFHGGACARSAISRRCRPPSSAARLGQRGLRLAGARARRGRRGRSCPMLDDERFEAALELEWPIEGLEPLSFVLTRLLEPLSTRLERRDRGAAVLHVQLRLVTQRDARAAPASCRRRCATCATLRTLALLDLESHPPAGGDRSRRDRRSIRRRAACCSTRCSRARIRRPSSCRRCSRGWRADGAGPHRRAGARSIRTAPARLR